MKKIALFILLSAVHFSACRTPELGEDAPLSLTEEGYLENGVFITNEGQFQVSSGTVSYYNKASGAVAYKLFRQKNNRDLGNVVQSMTLVDSFAYIVVNNANRVEKVNAKDFRELAQIQGLEQPRYFLPISNQEAYISQWGLDGLTASLAILDLSTNQITGTISTAKGAEQLTLASDGRVYLSCVGGYSQENKVQVFNTSTHYLDREYTVLYAPNSLVEDKNGMIWVACRGHLPYSTTGIQDTLAGGLIKIDPSSNTASIILEFEKGKGAQHLCTNRDKNQLYFTSDGGIWTCNLNGTELNRIVAGSFYGLGIDPYTDLLYATVYEGLSNARVNRYELAGTFKDSFTAGVFANGFVFAN